MWGSVGLTHERSSQIGGHIGFTFVRSQIRSCFWISLHREACFRSNSLLCIFVVWGLLLVFTVVCVTRAEMPFTAKCNCSKHVEWGHAEQKDVRVASFYEEKYCMSDPKHGSRKRKICLACRNRITVEEKCRKLEFQVSQSLLIRARLA